MRTEATEVSTPTVPILKVVRLGTRRLTRAHLALSQRPMLRQGLAAAVAPVASELAIQLGCPVELAPRLLEAAFIPRNVLPRTAAYAVLELSSCGAFAVLELELPYAVSFIGRLSGGPARLSAATTFTRIEEAAFGFLCLLALSALRRHAPVLDRFSPRLTGVWTDRAEVLDRLDCRAPHVGIELLVDVGGERGAGRLLIPSRVLQASLQGADPEPLGELAPQVGAAQLPAVVRGGVSHVTQEELRRLEVDDVVVFDRLRIDGTGVHGEMRLHCAGFVLEGTTDAAGFHFHRATPRAFPPESPMPPSDFPPPLPVDIEVELTRVRLSVSELATLRAGTLVPLHINAAEPVLLRVGDRAIARAELVEIEGEVGARILALLP